MRIPRIFQNRALNIYDIVILDSDQSHKLRNVLRLPKESTVTLFNGNGCEYTGTIVEAKTDGVKVKIHECTQKNYESPLNIYLGQVISKGEKMDFVIQKATELGVFSIHPLLSERCVVHLKNERLEKKLEHWQKIAVHAAEQSGRAFVPLIKKPIPLLEWLHTQEIKATSCRFFLDPNATNSLATIKVADPSALLIGPEGGLTEVEIEHATNNQFQGLRLGKRILRTETAALVALTALQCKAGDF